jgi:hypothetical protein
MNFSKILVSSIAAASVVGSIGLAYAQTSTTDVPANSTGPMTPPTAPSPSATPVETTPSPQLVTPVPATTQSAPMPDSTINSTVNPTNSAPPADGAMSSERAAQVDRN